MERLPAPGNGQILTGALLLVLGIILTVFAMTSRTTGGRSIIFVGLIASGVISLVRGIAANSNPQRSRRRGY